MNNTKEGKKDVIYLQVLGGFSISFDGRLVAGDAKSKESQFTYLMQLLLHYRGRGVRRDTLEQVLFGDRDIRNTHHALQSVLYNAKKQLRQAGLPEKSYIVRRNGSFYWTEEIPVIEDAGEFERLYQEAEAEGDRERQLRLYLDACHSYGGEFLPAHTGMTWAAQEARRYHMMFCACMERTIALLREQREYRQMEALGRYAAGIDPMEDWEAVTMEALMALGAYERAGRFYEATADRYLKEQGQQPSVKMRKLLKRLSDQMLHRHEVLEAIQAQLSGKSEERSGGYLCPYSVFQGFYQMAERLSEKEKHPAYLLLCTILDSKGNPLQDDGRLKVSAKRLEEAILSSVECGDVVNQYGRGQYLVLLFDREWESCKRLQETIRRCFRAGHPRSLVQYDIKPIGASLSSAIASPQAIV